MGVCRIFGGKEPGAKENWICTNVMHWGGIERADLRRDPGRGPGRGGRNSTQPASFKESRFC